MIQQLSGDILLTRAQALAHGVAPNDHFNSGLALSLREQWPALYKDFRHYCHTTHAEPGGLWSWVGADGRRIVNLFTQSAAYEHGSKPGPATVEYVNHCLRELRKLIEHEHLRTVALPRLATGVGGLDWEDVQPLITSHLGTLPVTILLYSTYRKGVDAEAGIAA